MALRDLTTLARVKTLLGVPDAATDASLALLISSQSATLRARLGGRDLLYQSYTETRDGTGARAITPRQYPVLSVSSVKIDNVTIPAQPAYAAGDVPPYGYVVVDDRIELEIGGGWPSSIPLDADLPGSSQPATFRRGRGNVLLVYQAGFLVTGEAATVPGSPYQVQSAELFYSDVSVKYSDTGLPLAKVASAPAQGQYAVNANGLYTFAAADTARGVLLSYGYIPAAIEQAVIDMVAWRHFGRKRIGEVSQIIGGQSVAFSQKADPPSLEDAIRDFGRLEI